MEQVVKSFSSTNSNLLNSLLINENTLLFMAEHFFAVAVCYPDFSLTVGIVPIIAEGIRLFHSAERSTVGLTLHGISQIVGGVGSRDIFAESFKLFGRGQIVGIRSAGDGGLADVIVVEVG